MESYLQNISRDNEWAGDVAALATEEALCVQINIISSDSDYVATVSPNMLGVSETICDSDSDDEGTLRTILKDSKNIDKNILLKDTRHGITGFHQLPSLTDSIRIFFRDYKNVSGKNINTPSIFEHSFDMLTMIPFHLVFC